MICTNCGATIDDDSKFCSSCGMEISSAQPFPADEVSTNISTNVSSEAIMTHFPTRKHLFMILIVALIFLSTVLFLTHYNRGPDFQKIYNDYCKSIWADLGSDGSYLFIDTNPFDEDDNGLAYPAAYTAIKEINKFLGLPESINNDMGETTSADGKQVETFEKLNLVITWKYHPDKGLEVTYKKIK